MTFEAYDSVGRMVPTMSERRRELERTPLPVNTFARSAGAAALDTIMAPVTTAGRAARALGYPNKAADLSGAEAIADVESLARDETTTESRERHELGRKAHPYAAASGDIAGEALAGAATAGAMRGAPAVRSEAARAFGGSRGSQRGFAGIGSTTPEAEKAGEFLRKHPNFKSLKSYIADGYARLNRELRTGDLSRESAERAAELQILLNDATRKGHTVAGTVYRGLAVHQKVIDDWLKRGAIRNRSFWSTSGTPDVSDTFAYPNSSTERSVLLKLESKSGVPIGRSYNGGGAEDEVLMNSGKNWLIQGTEQLEDGRLLIRAKEVDELPDGIDPAISYDSSRQERGNRLA